MCEDVENWRRLSYIASSTHNSTSDFQFHARFSLCFKCHPALSINDDHTVWINGEPVHFKCTHLLYISCQVWGAFQIPPHVVGGTLD